MITAGVWLAHRTWVAVVQSEDCCLAPIRAPDTRAGIHQLLDYLAALEIDTLVVTDAHKHLLACALDMPCSIQLAPRALLNGIRAATQLDRAPAKQTARLLARWPLTAPLCLLLQQYRAPVTQPDQLRLF